MPDVIFSSHKWADFDLEVTPHYPGIRNWREKWSSVLDTWYHLEIIHSNKESIACWCHQLNTLPDKCRLNWWLNCTKKFSMNPIEILKILAIAVHSFSEMLGWPDSTPLRTVQMSAGTSLVQPVQRAARHPAHIRINPILTKQKKNQRKLPSAGHCIVAHSAGPGSSSAPGLLAN